MIIARSSVDSEYDSSGEVGFKGGEESGTDSSYSRGPHAWPNSRAKWNRPDRRRQAKLRVKFAEGTLSDHSKCLRQLSCEITFCQNSKFEGQRDVL